jgi:hypothetical protein
MWVFRLLHALALVCGLLVSGAVTVGSARAQSDAERNALNQRVSELYRAGKYNEAVPLAEQYAEAMKASHGADHPEYAIALNNLAHLLHAPGPAPRHK